MKNAIIGKKIGMTRIFDKEGNSVPVTLVYVEPVVVTQVKKIEKNGFYAVQVGYQNKKNLNKPEKGHLQESKANSKYLAEFNDLQKELNVGDKINIDCIKVDDLVSVTGISKGKGFSGVIKRHGFSRGPESHGSDHHRAPGSIGGGYPQRVIKGKRMAGRMGNQNITIKNLKVLDVNLQDNTLLLKGSVPGPKNSILKIKVY